MVVLAQKYHYKFNGKIIALFVDSIQSTHTIFLNQLNSKPNRILTCQTRGDGLYKHVQNS